MTELANASIETALETAILKDRRLPALRDHWYMSSLGLCPRRQVGERAGLAPTNPPNLEALIKLLGGTVIGKELQRLLVLEGFLEADSIEQPITYRSCHGKLDGRTLRIPEGAVVEIKTSDDDSITRYKTIPESYLWQGFAYCLATGIPNLLIFQVGRSYGLHRHQVFRFDGRWEGLINDSITRMDKTWDRYQETQRLPDCLHLHPWENKWCPFRDTATKESVHAAR